MHLGGVGWGGGVKPPIHFYSVLDAKRGGEGVQIACEILYVINGRPLNRSLFDIQCIITRIKSYILPRYYNIISW